MSTELQPRPSIGSPSPWRFPTPTRTRLDNGLSLLVVNLPGKPLLAVDVLLDVRTATEPTSAAGLSVLAGRALDEGTEVLDAEAFAAALDRCGATFHTRAREDGLVASLDVPASRFDTALELAAQALLRPAFPADAVERLVAERLDEIEQEHASPDARAHIALRTALYADGQRLALPSGGTVETVTGLDAAAVRAHYEAGADPSRATVVVAGDLSGIDVPAAIARAFGSWTARAGASAEPVAPTPAPGRRVLLVDRPGAVQTELLLGLVSVDRNAPDYGSLSLATHVLGGTLTSRIDMLLREEKGYTYGMRAALQPRRRDGRITIGGSVDTPSTGPAMADLVGVLRGALDGGLTAEECRAAGDYLAGVAPLRWETPQAVAQHVIDRVGNDVADDWTDRWLEVLRTADVDAANAALRAHLRLADLVVVAVGDADATRSAFEDADLGEITVVRES